jgi:hypothetical protein
MRDETCEWQHGVVLVCINEREPGHAKPSCGRANGKLLKGWLKSATRAESGPVANCRVLETSCLDTCPADGLAVALMPGNKILVVDPVADRQALLARTRAHMEKIASGAERGSARRVLSRLRRR